ncbi:MAG: hypothetical protein LBT29_05560 [Flavobacteriaceae bacterium]|nr:hypothetical protein [Flavobacteriaceae bacterium]
MNIIKLNYFLLPILLFSAMSLKSQVTIGSGEVPEAGAALQLKNIPNVTDGSANSDKGLGLPRLLLADLNDLAPTVTAATPQQQADHTGLMVYNIGDCPGVYIWTGMKWAKLGEPCASKSILGLNCAGINPDVIDGKIGISLTKTVSLPYTVTGAPYVLVAKEIGPVNGITAKIAAQTLPVGSGNISITLSGTPNTSSLVNFPIEIDSTSCSKLSLDISQDVVTPADCGNGSTGFVFQQAGVWYAVGLGTFSGKKVGKVYGPFATEDEALREPNAIQLCTNGSLGFRCLRFYNRQGTSVISSDYFTFNSTSGNLGGIFLVVAGTGCTETLKANPGEVLLLKEPYTSNAYTMGAVKATTDGNLYLGANPASPATLTNKSLK